MIMLVKIRPVVPPDYEQWHRLWLAYNEFYGRVGRSAIGETSIAATWMGLLGPEKLVRALVAEQDGRLVGLAHYLFRVTPATNEPCCYLNALFTIELVRGRGVGRALMNELYERAREAGALRVYCQTMTETDLERDLYDKFAALARFIMYPLDDDSLRGLS